MRITANDHLKDMYLAMRREMKKGYHFDESLPASGPKTRELLLSNLIPGINRPANKVIQAVIARGGPISQAKLVRAVRVVNPYLSHRHIKRTLDEMLKAEQLALVNHGGVPWNKRTYSLPI